MSPVPSVAPGGRPVSPMSLLEQGVPLSLLLDLALGPRSEEVLREEALLPAQRASAE